VIPFCAPLKSTFAPLAKPVPVNWNGYYSWLDWASAQVCSAGDSGESGYGSEYGKRQGVTRSRSHLDRDFGRARGKKRRCDGGRQSGIRPASKHGYAGSRSIPLDAATS